MEGHVRSALVALSSPGANPGAINTANDTLMNYEEQCADAYVLYLASLSTSSPSSLRLSSVLVLKAAVKRRWKDKGRGKPGQMRVFLDETTKAHVRSCLISVSLTGRLPCGDTTNLAMRSTEAFGAEQLEIIQDSPLQTNVAALTATIARMDLPTRFQELIPTLVSSLSQTPGSQEGPTTMQEQVFRAIRLNVLTTLESVLAEVSTKRLLIDRKYRNSIAVAHLGQIYQCGMLPSLRHLDVRLRADRRNQFDLDQMMKYSMLATRVVAYLLGSSFVKLSDGATLSLVDQVILTIQSFIGQWLPVVIAESVAAEEIDLLKELLKLQMQLVVDTQVTHPMEFGRFLGGFLAMFYTTLVTLLCDRTVTLRNSEITVVLLQFLTNVVGCGQYANAYQVKHELEGVFTAESVQTLARLMLHLFAIHSQVSIETEEDVIRWDNDPEGFFHWEQQQSSDENLASAAQNCFLALAESPLFGGVVFPILLSTLSNVASLKTAVDVEPRNGEQSVNGTDLLPLGSVPDWPIEDIKSELVFQWDVVLTAAGLLASTLEGCNSFCFASWFRNVLSGCIIKLLRCSDDQTKSRPVLLRRLIWLLSCNAAHLDMTPSPSPIELVASTLASNQDMCLRLTSVQCLDALIPMCEENPALLQTLAESTVPCLYKTLEDSDHHESRSMCLDLIANLVSYVGAVGGELSSSTLNIIVSPLRFIFDSATAEHLLLRRNVLAILSSVATFIGREQVKLLYPLALPLLHDCLADQTNLFMREEALQAWYVYLRLSSSYEPTLGDLFECCATRISLDLRHLPVLMKIIEMYVLLGGRAFLGQHALTLQATLRSVVSQEINPRATSYFYLVIETILRAYPVDGGSLLLHSDVLQMFIRACASNHFGGQDCDPDRVIVLYLAALARVFLSDPRVMDTLLPVVQLASGTFHRENLVDLYLAKFQVAGNGAHGLMLQKLYMMFLLSIPMSHSHQTTNEVLENCTYILRNRKDSLLPYSVGHDEEDNIIDLGDYDVLVAQHMQADIVSSTDLFLAVQIWQRKLAALHSETVT